MPDNAQWLRKVERAMFELRGGYPIVLEAAGSHRLCWIEAGEAWLSGAKQAAYPQRVVVSGMRAKHLGWVDEPLAAAYALPADALLQPEQLPVIIDPLHAVTGEVRQLKPMVGPATAVEERAIELVKLAGLLPVVIVAPVEAAEAVRNPEAQVLSLPEDAVAWFHESVRSSVVEVSRATVPLRGAEKAEVIAFRPRYGGQEHLAVAVGQPEKADAPLVRVHSSCVTGDVLSSLRCDCGEQLHEAIARMAREGGGYLLYLMQEGRGIGIANKLRAYQLQDKGLDTVEANEVLGFYADERDFALAAALLQSLNIRKIRLLSNNPDKIAQLACYGVVVEERIPLALPANVHNARYLETKKLRCGHQFV